MTLIMPDSLGKILVVDDDETMRLVLETRLSDWGYEVLMAGDGESGRQLAESASPDIVLSDVVMPELSGLDLLRALKTGNPARPVVLMTAQGSVDMAVEAMKAGACDFLTKPLEYPKLKAVLDAVTTDLHELQESQRISSQLDRGAGFGRFVGTSTPMREVYQLLERLAATDVAAFITGASGTGKELAARTIHDRSSRKDGPFIAINAAAIPEGLIESEVFGHEKGSFTGAVGMRQGCFELADGGTLFLDEIAEMPMPLQPKLLRVLEDGRVRRVGGSQEHEFDVRIVAATNRDPQEAVAEGKLRQDLFFRLNVFTVALPPLRDRTGDIPSLVQYLIRQFNEKHGTALAAVRPEVWELLKSYSWPGNVRELRNVVERAVILARGEWIEIAHLPPYLRNPEARPLAKIVLPAGVTAAESEKELILKTLEQTKNNKAEAARRLGLDVKTIRNKLKTYGVS